MSLTGHIKSAMLCVTTLMISTTAAAGWRGRQSDQVVATKCRQTGSYLGDLLEPLYQVLQVAVRGSVGGVAGEGEVNASGEFRSFWSAVAAQGAGEVVSSSLGLLALHLGIAVQEGLDQVQPLGH